MRAGKAPEEEGEAESPNALHGQGTPSQVSIGVALSIDRGSQTFSIFASCVILIMGQPVL